MTTPKSRLYFFFIHLPGLVLKEAVLSLTVILLSPLLLLAITVCLILDMVDKTWNNYDDDDDDDDVGNDNYGGNGE